MDSPGRMDPASAAGSSRAGSSGGAAGGEKAPMHSCNVLYIIKYFLSSRHGRSHSCERDMFHSISAAIFPTEPRKSKNRKAPVCQPRLMIESTLQWNEPAS